MIDLSTLQASDDDSKAKEAAERLAKEEAERLAKVEAERLAKVEAERLAKEEAERKAQEEVSLMSKPTLVLFLSFFLFLGKLSTPQKV